MLDHVDEGLPHHAVERLLVRCGPTLARPRRASTRAAASFHDTLLHLQTAALAHDGASAPFTHRQGQYLAYIQTYTRLHGQRPSEAEIAAYFGKSPPSAHQMVDTLARRGLLERTPGQARSLRVTLPPEAVPDLGSRPTRSPAEPAFAAAYPHLARWIMGDGWVELGRTDYTRSMARALDEGGMVWEGKDSYPTVEELLRDLDAGIAQWIKDNA